MFKQPVLYNPTAIPYLPEVEKIMAKRKKYFGKIKNVLETLLGDKFETLYHTHRVTNMSYLLAKEQNLKKGQLFLRVAAANSHDVGKHCVFAEALHPQEFSEEHRQLISRHPQDSYRYILNHEHELDPKDFGIQDILRIAIPVLLHHRYQGKKSYPEIDMKASGIPDEDQNIARQLALADVFDRFLFGSPRHGNLPIAHDLARILLNKQFGLLGYDAKIDFLFSKYELIKSLHERSAVN